MSRIALLKKLDAWIGPLLIRLFSLLPLSQQPLTELRRVLFIRPGGIGDAVLLVAALKVLKSICPNVKIDILAERRNFKAFTFATVIEGVYCYDRPAELLRVLRREYDVVVDTEQWHRLSALIARMIRSSRKIGFGTNERELMFTDTVGYSHDDYELQSFLHLIEPLLDASPRFDFAPFLTLPDGVRKLQDIFDPDGSYVVFFPGASIEERKWGRDNFVALAQRLQIKGLQVVIVGGTEDAQIGKEIASRSAAVNLTAETSLLETASVLKDAALLVSGDSGVLHIGVGLGTRTISLFGPGIEKKWAPRGERHSVINHRLSCSPCTIFGSTPKCEIGARCIQGITVEEVFAAVEKQMASWVAEKGNL